MGKLYDASRSQMDGHIVCALFHSFSVTVLLFWIRSAQSLLRWAGNLSIKHVIDAVTLYAITLPAVTWYVCITLGWLWPVRIRPTIFLCFLPPPTILVVCSYSLIIHVLHYPYFCFIYTLLFTITHTDNTLPEERLLINSWLSYCLWELGLQDKTGKHKAFVHIMQILLNPSSCYHVCH